MSWLKIGTGTRLRSLYRTKTFSLHLTSAWAVVVTFAFAALNAAATIFYVDANSSNPTPPYNEWSTAAQTIQDALDASSPGDQILVTNGVYQSGGRFEYGSLSNRVVVDKAVTVQSVNGPAVTAIEGYLDATDGSSSVRCIYLTNDAKLIGFTLTNGAPAYDGDPILEQSGGGAFCDGCNVVISNCWMIANWGTLYGAGVYGGILNNCVFVQNNGIYGGGAYNAVLNCCTLSNNTAEYGGAAENSQLADCTVIGNSAGSGGGIDGGTAMNCIITNNSGNEHGGGAASATLISCTICGNNVAKSGGGADGCTLRNCTLTNNLAGWGGGASGSNLTNCLICGNQAGLGGGTDGGAVDACLIVANAGGEYGGGCEGGTIYNSIIANNSTDLTGYGGGVDAGTLYNCVIATNSSGMGGGAFESTLNNCTVVGNSAQQSAGGVSETVLGNCIVYYNEAPVSPNYDVMIANDPEYLSSSANYCCTTPLPTNGLGNIAEAPLFANSNDLHLQSTSPCINSGNNAYMTNSTDLDGNPRIVGGTVDIGAYEFQTPTSIISYAWLEQYGLPTDGSVDFLDLDGTGMNDYQKWIAGLDPTNASSVFVMLPPVVNTNSPGTTVSWQCVTNRSYNLERATNLSAQLAFSIIQSNIPGSFTGTNSYTDLNALGQGPYFYRVGVQR